MKDVEMIEDGMPDAEGLRKIARLLGAPRHGSRIGIHAPLLNHDFVKTVRHIVDGKAVGEEAAAIQAQLDASGTTVAGWKRLLVYTELDVALGQVNDIIDLARSVSNDDDLAKVVNVKVLRLLRKTADDFEAALAR